MNTPLDIYAGAGQCDITKGTRVGLLTVDYDGTTATVTYETCGNYTMTETHLYVGNDILAWDDNSADPGYTVAPGQYPYIHENLGNVQTDVFTVAATGDIYVVAHAVVWGDYEEGDCGVRGCVNPYKIWNLPTYPVTVTMPSGAHPGTNNNYFDLTLSGVGDGYDIMDGIWPGWCVDEHVYIYYNTPYTATIYSSYDPNLPSWATDDEQWDYINYILNHKAAGATYVDIQSAIWYFSEAGNPIPGGLAGDMVNDALANGAGFRPSSGEYGAVILAIGTNVQLVFIEVDP